MKSGQVTKNHDLRWFILRSLNKLYKFFSKHVDRYSEMLGDRRQLTLSEWERASEFKREFVIEVFYIVWNIRFKTLVNKSVITACRPIDPSLGRIKHTDFFGLGSKHPVSILWHRFHSFFGLSLPQALADSRVAFFLFAHTSPWMHFIHIVYHWKMRYKWDKRNGGRSRERERHGEGSAREIDKKENWKHRRI